MNNYEGLTRSDLISRIHELEARAARLENAGADCSGIHIPVLGEREQPDFESSPYALRIFDHESMRYLAVNDAAVRLYGYSRDEFLALPPGALRHPEERPHFFSSIREPTGLMRHGPARRHVKKSGEVMIVDVVVQDVVYQGRRARLSLTIDVTERCEADEEIKRQKKLVDTIVEHMPMGVFLRDAKTLRFLFRNRFSQANFGYARGDMIGKTLFDLFPSEQADVLRNTDLQALETGRMVEISDFELLGTGGDTRTVHIRKIPVAGEDGRPWLIVGIVDDVTERRRIGRALRESERRYRRIVENAREGIWTLDAHGITDFVNPRTAEMLGRPPGEMIGRSPLEFVAAEDRERLIRIMEYRRGRIAKEGELQMLHQSGETVWIRYIASPILNDDGRYAGALALITDITTQKTMEHVLRESEERLRLLAENIEQVFWITTLSGRELLYVSPAYEKIWGESCESLYRAPRSWLDHVHPDDQPAVAAAAAAIALGRSMDMEFRIVRRDGATRWIRDRSFYMERSSGERHVCGVAVDITPAKKAEAARMTAAVRQRDALVREVHHRIKNNLQGVVGLLRQKVKRAPGIAREIDEAVGQLQTVALVYGLQGRDSGGPPVIAALLDSICVQVQRLTGGRVERAGRRCWPASAAVASDEAVSVAVALNELVFNAIKHNAGAEEPVEVSLHGNADAAEIRISNPGHLPAAFDFAHGDGLADGLDLVKTLMSHPDCAISFRQSGRRVEVRVGLRPPLLVTAEGGDFSRFEPEREHA